MKYVTGVHALNIPCSLSTSGDWHQSALQWRRPRLAESSGSLFGDYGIEHGRHIPEHAGTYNVANHIRALLDLIADGKFTIAQGMNRDYISNEHYTNEIFEKVAMLRSIEKWPEIDRFMGREYYAEWLDFKEKRAL
ncbi:hypothetical protein [Ethanoligenens sp.]|uniref:hypothetical protein n=1 Tax=Ethanoligenens sp. TaxID=2099655 RepID=UPI0039E7F4F4